jgi:hypothetical protein
MSDHHDTEIDDRFADLLIEAAAAISAASSETKRHVATQFVAKIKRELEELSYIHSEARRDELSSKADADDLLSKMDEL